MTVDNNTTSTTGNASTGAASDENSQENKEELQADAENSTASNTTTEEPAVVDLGTEKKLKKRTFRVPLKVCILAYCFQAFFCVNITDQFYVNI